MADPRPPSIEIRCDADELRPLIHQIVAETLAQLDADKAQLGDQIAYSEAEAARLIGLTERQLADERRRGRIQASSIVCRRIRYLRSDLTSYLLAHRWTGESQA